MILNQTFLAFCSKHVLPLRIKPFRQERIIYQVSHFLTLVKGYYLSHNVAPSKVFFSRPWLSTYFIKREHQKFRVNGRKWSLCYNTFGIYSEYLSFGAKAKSFNPCSEAAFERCFTMSSVFLTLQGLVLWVLLHVTFWILTSPIDPPK